MGSIKQQIFILLLGLGIGFGASFLHSSYKIKQYETELKRLEDLTKDLKYKLSLIENQEDSIKQEVKREQANKSAEQIVAYWTEHYSRARNAASPSR